MKRIRNITTYPDSQGKCKNCGYEDEGKEKCGRCQCSYDFRPGYMHLPYLPITATGLTGPSKLSSFGL